jgi:hypothetical protein
MANEGLFSDLKFTDIFFPAAAAVASAYNPYVGSGIRTGLDLFNSMAGFKNNLQYWQEMKRAREEQDRRNADLQEAIGGLDSYLTQRQNRLENTAGQQIRGEVDEKTLQQMFAGGMPMEIPGVPGMMPGFSPGAGQQWEGRFSDLPPEVIQQQALQRLQDPTNPLSGQYAALQERQAMIPVLEAGAPLNAGSVLSTLGGYGLQQHGSDLDQSRYATLAQSAEDNFKRQVELETMKKAGWVEAAGQVSEQNIAAKAQKLEMARQYAKDIYAIKDEVEEKDLTGMGYSDLIMYYGRIATAAARQNQWADPQIEGSIEAATVGNELAVALKAEIDRRVQAGTVRPGQQTPTTPSNTTTSLTGTNYEFDPVTGQVRPVLLSGDHPPVSSYQ